MRKSEEAILKTVRDFVRRHRCQGRGAVCVLAPWFVPAQEGYLQRVAAIDEEVLAPLACIHLDFETGCSQPGVQQKDDRHLVVELCPHDGYSLNLACYIARQCGVLYVHSVMRAMADIMGKNIHRLFTRPGLYVIWDVHGAVPEEYVMQPNFYEAQNATQAEELLLKNACTIVTISEAMKTHFEQKYGQSLQGVINTSVFNVTHVNEEQILAHKKKLVGPLTAAYAGNTMPWQNIPLMQRLMVQAGPRFRYRVFTPQPETFYALAQEQDLALPPCTVQKATPSQVLEAYADCQLGFALRDDTAVNHVACPTKVMEYIQFGLIPVLKTPHIGDFDSLGLRYIPYEEFACWEGQEYLEAVTCNFALLQKLQLQHEQGTAQLRELVRQKAKGRGR